MSSIDDIKIWHWIVLAIILGLAAIEWSIIMGAEP